MNKITYIVASYSGKDRKGNGDLSDKILQINISELIKWLKFKQFTNTPHHIHEVIIVRPQTRTEPYKYFYKPELWRKQLSLFGIRLIFLSYFGKNIDYSYDQWIQGCLTSNSEYNLIIEDDYCINSNNLNWDEDIINLYNQKFPNGIGYLTQWASEEVDGEYFGYHAAISNGLISKKTMIQLNDPINRYFSISNNLHPQIKFSNMFLENNIQILDMKDVYKLPFWVSHTQSFRDFSDINAEEYVFIPVQHVFKKI